MPATDNFFKPLHVAIGDSSLTLECDRGETVQTLAANNGVFSWNANLGRYVKITLTADATLANVTNIPSSLKKFYLIIESAGYNLTYGNGYYFSLGSPPPLSTSGVDIISFINNDSKLYCIDSATDYKNSTYSDNVNTSITLPVGSIIAAAYTPNVSSGWLYCDGASIGKTGATYSGNRYRTLYDIVAGKLDGITPNWDTTNSTIPDFRGYFLRGYDGTQVRDRDFSSRGYQSVGGTYTGILSVQSDAVQKHQHKSLFYNANGSNLEYDAFADYTVGSSAFLKIAPGTIAIDSIPSSEFRWGIGQVSSGTVTSETPRTSLETRPLNSYVYFLIKYK